MWHRLISNDILGKSLTIIRSMYRQLRNRIRVGIKYSDIFEGVIGLRQGESLSPLLYSFLINDLQKSLASTPDCLRWSDIVVSLILYADDGCVISDSEGGLQRNMVTVGQFCDDWNIQLNCQKTEIIVFGNNVRDPVIMYKGTVLRVVKTFKYLGATFSTDGGWNANIAKLLDQSRKALMCLRP